LGSESHYEVQRSRRKGFIEEWRTHRQTVVPPGWLTPDGVSASVAGYEQSTYLGTEGGRPTRFLDAKENRLAAGTVTPPHSHTWDAVVFILEGTGRSTVGGKEYRWGPWDAIHTPSLMPHFHEATTDARFMSFSSYPLLRDLGAAWFWDGDVSHMPADGPRTPTIGVGPARQQELASDLKRRHDARIHTDYDDEELRTNRKGTRSKFLVDPSIGFDTSGLTMVMTQYAPGGGQAMHCHPGEAFLFVVEGEGESYIGYEPDGGTWYPWKTGDIVVVDHFVWHQHWNRNDEKPARLLRVHMMDTMLMNMQAVMDPIELLIEPDEMMRKMPDPDSINWPEDVRPTS
jgi:quercetin dioxygenase-like cupin family protein